MATIIRMPEVAANATHATLVSWSKKEGDEISSGESIADVETEKAIIELNVEAQGTVARLLVNNGTEVAVGAPIAVLIDAGESVADADRILQSTPEKNASATLVSDPEPRGSQASQRVFSSPVARLLAKQHGLDLNLIVGSGPNGRIVKYDVLRAIQNDGESNISSVPARIKGSDTLEHPAQAAFSDTPHTNMRRTIARRLTESKSTVPHFYLTVECRMDNLIALRTEINTTAQVKISVNDFIVLAAARALRDVPKMNVSWTEAAIREYHQVDISIAVSTQAGLITPILRNVNSKSLSQISFEIRALADRSKQGQLRPDEFQGGSFSISNLGMYGVDEFAAIINPPQAAILAVGAVKAQPVVNSSGVIEAGQIMRCTLSVDHRAVDGALAATWLAAFRRYIESPSMMLI